MTQSSRPARILIGLMAVVAVGLGWWLLTCGGPGTAPLATAAPVPRAAAPAAVVAPAGQPAPTPEPAAPAVAAAPVAAAVPVVVKALPLPPAVAVPVPVPVTAEPLPLPVVPIDEVAATERMYLAHASLRAPEVADPDSETNRRILETMVTKALAPPVATPSAPVAH